MKIFDTFSKSKQGPSSKAIRLSAWGFALFLPLMVLSGCEILGFKASSKSERTDQVPTEVAETGPSGAPVVKGGSLQASQPGGGGGLVIRAGAKRIIPVNGDGSAAPTGAATPTAHASPARTMSMAQSPLSSPRPSPTPSTHASASSTPTFPPASKPTPAAVPLDPKSLLKEFTRAQDNELRSLKHRLSLEFKELKASQAQRQREWEVVERDERHKFFAANQKGPERRAYIKDYLGRRQVFLQMLDDEKKQRQQAYEVRIRSTQQDQATRLQEFKEFLSRGERPPERLWPQPGG